MSTITVTRTHLLTTAHDGRTREWFTDEVAGDSPVYTASYYTANDGKGMYPSAGQSPLYSCVALRVEHYERYVPTEEEEQASADSEARYWDQLDNAHDVRFGGME